MIKHIVMWRLKDFADGRSKKENLERMKTWLMSLKDKIKEVKRLEASTDMLYTDPAFDIVFYSEFEDEKALETYKNHPEHRKLVDFVSKIKETRELVDYRI